VPGTFCFESPLIRHFAQIPNPSTMHRVTGPHPRGCAARRYIHPQALCEEKLMSDHPKRIGLMGCGAVANYGHIPAILGTEGLDLVHVGINRPTVIH
jgi:hypothetical protein